MTLDIKYHEIDIQNASIKEIADLVEFHNSYYKSNRTPQFWDWQYRELNPKKAVFTIANCDGKIIGTQAMMPFYLKIGSDMVLTAKSENTLLLPEYRGLGVMENLYDFAVDRCVEREIKLIWGFSQAEKAFRRFGFQVVPQLQLFEKPNFNIIPGVFSELKKPNSIGENFIAAGKLSIKVLLHLKNPQNFFIRRINENSKYQISKGQIEIGMINDLLDRMEEKYPLSVHLNYDEEYINWRVKKHPLFDYKVYQVSEEDNLRAFSFITKVRGILCFSDFVSENRSATRILISNILNDNSSNTTFFRFYVNPCCEMARGIIESLTYLGFAPKSQSKFVLKDLSKGEFKHMENPDNWNTTAFWTEGYSM